MVGGGQLGGHITLHSAASICGYKEEGFIMVQHSNGLHRNRAIRHPLRANKK
jgi:hypothetical protein